MKYSNGIHIDDSAVYFDQKPMGLVQNDKWEGLPEQYTVLNTLNVVSFIEHEERTVKGKLNFPYYGLKDMNPEIKAFCLEFPAHAAQLYNNQLQEINANIFSKAVSENFLHERLQEKNFNANQAVEIIRNLTKLVLVGGEYALKEILNV